MNPRVLILLVATAVIAINAKPPVKEQVPKQPCPVVGFPQVEPGCRLETIFENGCSFLVPKCDKKRGKRAAKCPKIAPPKLTAGCTSKQGKDASGCTTYTIDCAPINRNYVPPAGHIVSPWRRMARAAKGKCPSVKAPKAPAGCKLETGKDANGCPTWSIGCNGRKKRAARCPKIPPPQLSHGCTSKQGKDASGCTTYTIECGNINRNYTPPAGHIVSPWRRMVRAAKPPCQACFPLFNL